MITDNDAEAPQPPKQRLTYEMLVASIPPLNDYLSPQDWHNLWDKAIQQENLKVLLAIGTKVAYTSLRSDEVPQLLRLTDKLAKLLMNMLSGYRAMGPAHSLEDEGICIHTIYRALELHDILTQKPLWVFCAKVMITIRARLQNETPSTPLNTGDLAAQDLLQQHARLRVLFSREHAIWREQLDKAYMEFFHQVKNPFSVT